MGTGTATTPGQVGASAKMNLKLESVVNADVEAAAAIAFSKLAVLASARLLVGSAANVATAVDVTGDVTIGNTGVTAITGDVIVNADVNTAAAIVGSKLASNARRNHAKAFAKLDLSGAAQTDVVILHTVVACTLLKAILLYTEASSADAGVTVTIGKEATAAYYYTGTSETTQALWYEKDVTLLQTAIAAGDTVICGNAGSKTGTGEILVTIEYTVDD